MYRSLCNLFCTLTLKGLESDTLPFMNTLPSALHDGSDEALMLAVSQQQDRAAFAELMKRWKQPLMNYYYRQGNGVEVSEELLQEVFVKIWKTRNYRVQAKFSTWVYRVAQHLLIDHWRKQGRRPAAVSAETVLAAVEDNARSIEEQTLQHEREQRLYGALQQLSPAQRQVIVLSKFQQLKYSEIGEIMGWSESNVKVQVFRALKALKTYLGAHHESF